MAIQRRDEILGKALAGDATVIPRYDVIASNGTKVAEDAQLVLKNPILQHGMPYSATVMNEVLAASGTTSGTASELTLTQSGFALTDGAVVRIKLHVDSGATPTLNINGTGAKPIVDQNFLGKLTAFKQNTVVTLVYSSASGAYITQGLTDKLLENATGASVFEYIGWREIPPSSVRTYMRNRWVAYRRSDNTFITGENYEGTIVTSTDACRTYSVTGGSYPGVSGGNGQTMRVWTPTLGLVTMYDSGRYVYGTNLATTLTLSPDTTLNTQASSGWTNLAYVGNCLFAWCSWNSGTTGLKFGVRANTNSAFQLIAYPLDRMRVAGFAFDGATYYLAGNNTSHSRVLYSSPDGKTWTQVTISSSPSSTIIGLMNDEVTGDIYGVFTDSSYLTMRIGKLTQKSPAIFTQLGSVSQSFSTAMVATHCMHIANKFYVNFGASSSVGQWQDYGALWFTADGNYTNVCGTSYPLADNDSFYGYLNAGSLWGYFRSRTLKANVARYTDEYAQVVTGSVSTASGWITGTNIYLGFRPRWVIHNSAQISESSFTDVGYISATQGTFIAGR